MKGNPIIIFIICCTCSGIAQEFHLAKPDVFTGKLMKKAEPLREFQPDPAWQHIRVKGLKNGYVQKDDWVLHESKNDKSLPKGADPALQLKYPASNPFKNLIHSFEGMDFSEVNPSDPSIDVGPEHVVQMINGASGAYLKIFGKSGEILVDQVYFDSYTEIEGLGDPIVIYDQMADRWLLSEFAYNSNMLVVAISETGDPSGAYFIYGFETPYFPDYPKFAVWPDAYYVTTNEDKQAVYALDRAKMLAGQEATSQRFTMPNFPTIGFQAATPVGLVGFDAPPEGAPGLIMRMADDAWSENIEFDRLEIYRYSVDWEDPSKSTLTGPVSLATEPFDTELCGYTAFSCIEQPLGSIALDPMREILMNKIGYRNFGPYQALACTHVVDVDGEDHAAVRWYELRNELGDWEIHQQGTYAPDFESRWMSAIMLNGDGSMGLAYNVSSSETYPSLRFTGRKQCDPLGQMTLPETTLAEGSGVNISNRYGDYNTLAVDPVDETYWFTGQYNPGLEWETYIGNFEVVDDCYGYRLYRKEQHISVCSAETAEFEIELEKFGGYEELVNLEVKGLPDPLNYHFNINPISDEGVFTLEVDHSELVEPGTYAFEIFGSSGSITESVQLSLGIFRNEMAPATLVYPPDQEFNVPVKFIFEWEQMGNAEEYDLEVSKNPDFSDPVINVQGLEENTYPLLLGLEDSQVYYWRVRGNNLCSQGLYSPTGWFETEAISCDYESPGDLPIVIDDSGKPTIESTIEVFSGGIIRDVSLNNLTITHDWIGDLSAELESPSGTVIQLFDKVCSSHDDMFLSYSDDGIAQKEMTCPPTDGRSFQPLQSFHQFSGEQMTGEWILRIKDNANFDGGLLEGWTLEICTPDQAGLSMEECDGIKLIIDDPVINSSTYSAANTIESSGKVPESGQVFFQAMEGIVLNPGFEVHTGALFEARLRPCVQEYEVGSLK